MPGTSTIDSLLLQWVHLHSTYLGAGTRKEKEGGKQKQGAGGHMYNSLVLVAQRGGTILTATTALQSTECRVQSTVYLMNNWMAAPEQNRRHFVCLPVHEGEQLPSPPPPSLRRGCPWLCFSNGETNKYWGS